MNVKSIISLSIFVSYFYCCDPIHSSSDDEDEEPRQRIIAPINIEGCRATADAISNDMASDFLVNYDSEEEQRNEECLSYFGLFHPTVPSSLVVESEEQKIIKLQKEEENKERHRKRLEKLEKDFVQDELEIRDKALAILSKYRSEQKKYMRLIRGQNLYPSVALLEFTKDINAVPRALELLELIEDYCHDEYGYYFSGYDNDIGLNASYRIFNYYLDEYNKRAAFLSNPREMDRSLHDLLHLCQKHLPTHPMSGIDDFEHAMYHISEAIGNQLLTLNLWYLDNPKLIKDIIDQYNLQRLFTLSVRFLECTTYGVISQYFDLGYLLKSKKFVGIKMPLLSNPSEYQHLWVHPYLPLQVRITQNGKLTVGLLKENPLTPEKQLRPNAIKVDNELYKISIPSLSGYFIPARHKGDNYQKLWSEDIENNLKNTLMAEAHCYLALSDMKFHGMEKFLYNEPFEAQEEQKKKKPKKKK